VELSGRKPFAGKFDLFYAENILNFDIVASFCMCLSIKGSKLGTKSAKNVQEFLRFRLIKNRFKIQYFIGFM